MKWLLRTALSLIGATKLPFCGKTSIRPSSTSRMIALRTGVRDTPIWRQMRFSLMEVPGGNRKATIAFFNAS